MAELEKYFCRQLVNIEEIKEIIKALEPEFEVLGENSYKVLDNMFLSKLDEDGCARYESMLGIMPRDNDTLEDRRFRIMTLYKGDTPYTMISLKRKLEELCGTENVEITLDAANYKIKILIGLSAQSQYDAAYDVITKLLPCNMALTYSLKYNRHSMAGSFTHAQLAAYTHQQIRTDETIAGN